MREGLKFLPNREKEREREIMEDRQAERGREGKREG